MDDLLNQLEDAEYIREMSDNISKPCKSWNWPSKDEVESWHEENKNMSISKICENALGFYCFIENLLNEYPYNSHNDKLQIRRVLFLRDVALYRMTNVPSTRMELGQWILYTYFDYQIDIGVSEVEEPDYDYSLIYRPSCSISSTKLMTPTSVDSKSRDADCNWREYLFESLTDTENNNKNPLGLLNQESINKTIVSSTIDVDKWLVDAFDVVETAVFRMFVETKGLNFKQLPSNSSNKSNSCNEWMRYAQFNLLSQQTPRESDFTPFRVLGRGGFGMVNGCKHETTGVLYAMKAMSKDRVKAKKSEKLCWQERKILAKLQCPFICELHFAFTTKESLYLVLDIMMGGDLSFHLNNRGSFDIQTTKYYAARIVLALKAMHDLGIVYRDLKPENILLDLDGRCRLSDLGLACEVPEGGLGGRCGTRGYWAPEMMKDADGNKRKYGLAVDWFSFGCLIYECLRGCSPFRTAQARCWSRFTNAEKLLIMECEGEGGHRKGASTLGAPEMPMEGMTVGMDDIDMMNMNIDMDEESIRKEEELSIDTATKEMPPDFNDERFDYDYTVDFCRKLLEKDPSKRLGFGSNGVQDVMNHPWFADIDWSAVLEDRVAPPFVPEKDINSSSQDSIGDFDDVGVPLDTTDHERYEGWQYVHQESFKRQAINYLIYVNRSKNKGKNNNRRDRSMDVGHGKGRNSNDSSCCIIT